MRQNTYYCEECVEEIDEADVFWEEERAYCGKCGSELDMMGDETDLVDEFSGHGGEPPEGTVLEDLSIGDDEDDDDEYEEEEG